MNIYFWDEQEILESLKSSLGLDLVARDPEFQNYKGAMGVQFLRKPMKDKRGTFPAVEITHSCTIENREGVTIKCRLKLPTEAVQKYMDCQLYILLIPNMNGWADCSPNELWELQEVIDKRKKNPPEPKNILDCLSKYKF